MSQVRSVCLGAIGVLMIAAIPALAGPQPRVIGGSVANPAEWPAIAALTAGPQERQFCGGTLIAPQQVLTAKHCVVDPVPNFEVVIGRPDLTTSDGQEIEVVDTHFIPRADLAVLDLAVATWTMPFPLATPAQDQAATGPGDKMIVAGWGGTRPNGRQSSDVLLKVNQFGKPGKRCYRTYPFLLPSLRKQKVICALGRSLSPRQNGSSCYGDSGGPLVADTPQGRVLIGAVSGGGVRCGKNGDPSFYARVATKRNKILSHVP